MSEDNVNPTVAVEGVEGHESATATVQDIHGPEDIAAAFFQKEKPRLKALLSNMSAKQIRRFVMHVASYPASDAGDMPQTDVEKRGAYLFSEMMQNKAIMQLAYEMQKVEEAMKNETVTQEHSMVKGEENNG